MEQTRVVPHFETEEEEANWWEANEHMLVQHFQQAAANGTLGRGSLARLNSQEPTQLILDPADSSKARSIAQSKGLSYQTYLGMIIHEALEKE